MSPQSSEGSWGRFAEDVAALACRAALALAPDGERMKEVRRSVLKLEVLVLRGLLGIVEERLKEAAPAGRAAPEKIRIE